MTDADTISQAPIATAPAAVLLVDAGAAAALCGVSRATWFAWHSAGRIPLPALRAGRVVRWSAAELAAWISAGCPARDRWQAERGGRP